MNGLGGAEGWRWGGCNLAGIASCWKHQLSQGRSVKGVHHTRLVPNSVPTPCGNRQVLVTLAASSAPSCPPGTQACPASPRSRCAGGRPRCRVGARAIRRRTPHREAVRPPSALERVVPPVAGKKDRHSARGAAHDPNASVMPRSPLLGSASSTGTLALSRTASSVPTS